MATAVSHILLENHHSLSYQLNTLPNLPSITWVWVKSKFEEEGLWLKSFETKGSEYTLKIPIKFLDLDAALIALFIVSTDILFLETNLKSIKDTFGVGTLIAVPSNFPDYSGITSPTAFAAPVEVGIIDKAAALALLKSGWKVSRTLWSPV